MPRRSGIRILINVCEQFELDYDITFNGTKRQITFLKVDFLMFLLGHAISSGDRTEIVRYAKGVFGVA